MVGEKVWRRNVSEWKTLVSVQSRGASAEKARQSGTWMGGKWESTERCVVLLVPRKDWFGHDGPLSRCLAWKLWPNQASLGISRHI
jgi:hypothetical protein